MTGGAGRTALVTGAYGFVGRHVARHLAREGWVVRGLGHGAWARAEWREWGLAEWHVADVTPDALVTHAGAPALIVHCAGSGSVAYSMTHPHQDFQRTVQTTGAVLEFALRYAPQAMVVYPSSAGVYGLAPIQPIAETTPSAPVSPYGVHKRMAEELCLSYGRHFGLRLAIVRLFSVYGAPLRKQLLWDACTRIAGGDPVFFGTGAETRDWLQVEDAAALLAAVAPRADAGCPIFNGGTGTAATTREVLTQVYRAMGRDDAPRFSGESRPGDPQHYHADVARAQALGWVPRKDWQTGVADYVAWFRAGAP